MILQWPDPDLKQISEPVEDFSLHVELIKELLVKVSGEPRCLGLTAIQVGVPVRVGIVRYGTDVLALINPVMVKHSEKLIGCVEACFSVDDTKRRFRVGRYKRCRVAYQDMNGRSQKIRGEGRFAQVLQHELDHMDGKCVADVGVEVLT